MATAGGAVFFLSFLGCLLRLSLQESEWNCSQLTAVPTVVDQVLGKWYLLEVISSTLGPASEVCAGVDLTLMNSTTARNDTQTLEMTGFQISPNGSTNYTNYTTVISKNSPVWIHPGVAAESILLDLSRDNEYMSLTTCFLKLQRDWTCILSRHPERDESQIEAIHQRLRAAGLQNTETPMVYNMTLCGGQS